MFCCNVKRDTLKVGWLVGWVKVTLLIGGYLFSCFPALVLWTGARPD